MRTRREGCRCDDTHQDGKEGPSRVKGEMAAMFEDVIIDSFGVSI